MALLPRRPGTWLGSPFGHGGPGGPGGPGRHGGHGGHGAPGAPGAPDARGEELSPDELTALAERRPEALERFYDVYFERVYAYVRRLVKDEHAAEDLSQDIFMHLHRSLSSYDPRRALRPWVFTIATNKVRDYWSSRSFQDRAAADTGRDDEDAERAQRERSDAQRGPRESLAGLELGEAVAKAVEQLPEALRQTLVLRYFEGLSFAEIGRVMERNEVAVRKRYSRALEELRGLLAGLYADGEAEGGVG